MKRKNIPYVLIIFVMLFSFAFTSVEAQSPMPETSGILGDDGDQILGEVPSVPAKTEMVSPDLSKFTLRPDGFDPSQAVINLDAIAPFPLSPNYEIVIGKFPVFYFAQNYSASKYKVEVWDYYKGVVTYTLRGSGNCSGGVCSLKPTIALKTIGLDGKGNYAWRVRGKFGDYWGSWSEYTDFYVFAKGFRSEFSTTAKWYSLIGSWPIIYPGYVKIGGYPDITSSIIEKEEFLDWYVYEARMKRKIDYPSPNTLYFAAIPYLDNTGDWYSGYAFDYGNDQTFRVRRIDNGISTTLAGWYFSPYIKPFEWNKLTVWQDPPYLDFWINGEYLGFIPEETYTYGYVGIGMYRPDYTKSPLLVDSAKLTYTITQPYPYDFAGIDHDPAYNLTTSTSELVEKADGNQ